MTPGQVAILWRFIQTDFAEHGPPWTPEEWDALRELAVDADQKTGDEIEQCVASAQRDKAEWEAWEASPEGQEARRRNTLGADSFRKAVARCMGRPRSFNLGQVEVSASAFREAVGRPPRRKEPSQDAPQP